MKLVTVVGARPQFIKAAVVSRALVAHPGVTELILHTGQHHSDAMSEVFFRQLGMPTPAANLGVAGGGHGQMTGRMLEAIEQRLLDWKPDAMLVYGDTNSTLAGALAAAKLHIPVAHVEAGLRSFNRRMPEEINRVLTDHASDVLFPPTDAAAAQLRHEGLGERPMHQVGDVMYDSALYFGRTAPAAAELGLGAACVRGAYVLATIHRAENVDDPQILTRIWHGLQALAQHSPVVMPVHPRTRQALQRLGLVAGPGLHLLDPVGYFEMIALERDARLVVTDSGGVQKEAYFFGVPCLTVRGETEWRELVDCGANQLMPPDDDRFAQRLLAAQDAAQPVAVMPIYGAGDAGQRIAEVLACLG